MLWDIRIMVAAFDDGGMAFGHGSARLNSMVWLVIGRLRWRDVPSHFVEAKTFKHAHKRSRPPQKQIIIDVFAGRDRRLIKFGKRRDRCCGADQHQLRNARVSATRSPSVSALLSPEWWIAGQCEEVTHGALCRRNHGLNCDGDCPVSFDSMS